MEKHLTSLNIFISVIIAIQLFKIWPPLLIILLIMEQSHKLILYWNKRFINKNSKFNAKNEIKNNQKCQNHNSNQNLDSKALFLSGGGAQCKYHVGVVEALHENDLVPRTIVGTSCGAILGAYLCGQKYSLLGNALKNVPDQF